MADRSKNVILKSLKTFKPHTLQKIKNELNYAYKNKLKHRAGMPDETKKSLPTGKDSNRKGWASL